MANKGHSYRNIWGGYDHYDEKGRKIGSSDPSIFGGYNHYDEKGRKTGYSDPGFLGGYNHYDTHGRKTGFSDEGMFGSYNHYDERGRRTGGSDPGVLGGYQHNDTGGCYVATCVYGSYDCPQVWTLRRFRDGVLARYVLGRAFIRAYYAVSPTIVKWFGSAEWFRTFWRARLDSMVARLQAAGVEDTPYRDRPWKRVK